MNFARWIAVVLTALTLCFAAPHLVMAQSSPSAAPVGDNAQSQPLAAPTPAYGSPGGNGSAQGPGGYGFMPGQGVPQGQAGPQGADGTGTAVFKLCDPNCATGYQITKPVVVHAWNAQPARRDAICQVGLKIFNDMILAFPQGAPPPTAQKMDTQFSGMPAVHYVDYSPSSNGQTEFIGYTFCN